tara:strand:- start:59 stop:274 length:216 start_codon:yes stop_codon:yes gene_type:complete
MKRTRTYYCKSCKGCKTFKPEEKYVCDCGHVFGTTVNISDGINMRKTWSGQTQVEFTQTTMDADIADRNNR